MISQATNTFEILNAILDNSPESIVFLTPEHKVLAFNKVIKSVLTEYFDREIQIGDDFRDFVIPPNKELYTNAFNKALQGENVIVENETKFNSTSIWFEYKVNPVYNQLKELIGITLAAKNISKEKDALIALESMAETYEAIIENAKESIILLDPEFKVLQFNKIAKDRLIKNVGKELVIGSDFRNYLYADRQDVFYSSFQHALNGSETESEVHVKDINNGDIWIQYKIFPVYKRNGKLLGVAIFVLNVEARKKIEIELKESEEKFKKILQCAPSPILVVNHNKRITLANPVTESVFGYKLEELMDQNIQKLIPIGIDSFNIDSAIDIEIPIPFNTRSNNLTLGLKKNGEKIFIEVRLSKFQVNSDHLTLVIVEDVTDRIKAEQKIVNQLSRFEAIAWQQSHEVRRPVASILGIINLLKSVPNLTEQETSKYMESLYQVTQELDDVIHKIVDYTYDPEQE
jgi:PAS domain S-box-containing protein